MPKLYFFQPATATAAKSVITIHTKRTGRNRSGFLITQAPAYAGVIFQQGETKMKTLTIIPAEVAALIPVAQLEITKNNLQEFSEALQRFEASLKKCPNIGETDNLNEHPAIFHYFYGSTDIFICEYDRNNKMFGYGILNADLDNSEWGYFNLPDITNIPKFNIDYHFEEQSIEAALYTAYPEFFKKPLSLDEAPIGKNDPMPDSYRNFPYQYTRTKLCTTLRKGIDEVYLFGDEATHFYRECNRAKQKSRSISDVIEEYFIH